MRDTLPSKPLNRESAIVNLDRMSGLGTHWVAYKKRGNSVIYFDSFGDLKPPPELTRYLNVDEIKYNPKRYQDFSSSECGRLCLMFLCNAI